MKTKSTSTPKASPKQITGRAGGESLKRYVRIAFFALGTLALLLSPLTIQLGYCFEPTDGLDLQANSSGGDNKISYPDLVRLLNQYLENAQQVNLFVDSCHSGGLMTAAANLNMPYFVAVSQADPKSCAIAGSSSKDVVPPGRLTISPPGRAATSFMALPNTGRRNSRKPSKSLRLNRSSSPAPMTSKAIPA